MENTDIIWLVSEISAFLGEGLATTQGGIFVWVTPKGEVIFESANKEIQFVECELDSKTYFAIVGLAASRGLTTSDCYYEK
jgi:hypothetical protein